MQLYGQTTTNMPSLSVIYINKL